MWSSQDIKRSVYLFGLPSFVRIHCELQWQKKKLLRWASLVPKSQQKLVENVGLQKWKKGTQHQAISLLEPYENSE